MCTEVNDGDEGSDDDDNKNTGNDHDHEKESNDDSDTDEINNEDNASNSGGIEDAYDINDRNENDEEDDAGDCDEDEEGDPLPGHIDYQDIDSSDDTDYSDTTYSDVATVRYKSFISQPLTFIHHLQDIHLIQERLTSLESRLNHGDPEHSPYDFQQQLLELRNHVSTFEQQSAERWTNLSETCHTVLRELRALHSENGIAEAALSERVDRLAQGLDELNTGISKIARVASTDIAEAALSEWVDRLAQGLDKLNTGVGKIARVVSTDIENGNSPTTATRQSPPEWTSSPVQQLLPKETEDVLKRLIDEHVATAISLACSSLTAQSLPIMLTPTPSCLSLTPPSLPITPALTTQPVTDANVEASLAWSANALRFPTQDGYTATSPGCISDSFHGLSNLTALACSHLAIEAPTIEDYPTVPYIEDDVGNPAAESSIF